MLGVDNKSASCQIVAFVLVLANKAGLLFNPMKFGNLQDDHEVALLQTRAAAADSSVGVIRFSRTVVFVSLRTGQDYAGQARPTHPLLHFSVTCVDCGRICG